MSKKAKSASAKKAGAKKSVKLNLGNPVTVLANKVIALTNFMTDVAAAYDYDAKKVRLYCSDVEKADALNLIVNHHFDIGNLALDVEVVEATAQEATPLDVPLWTITQKAKHDAFGIVFDGFVKQTVIVVQGRQKWYFSEFAPIVASWQADDLQNPNGFQSATLADVVKEVFDTTGIQISTEVED